MSDTSLRQQAVAMCELFQCHPEVHGNSRLTGQINESKGKYEAKSWTVKRGVTPADWERHLSGRDPTVGCFPLRPDGTVRWAALDIDVYQDPSILGKVFDKIRTSKLPLIPCRSKSSGAHLYMFFNEDVPAKDVIKKLKELSSYFGQATSEIFPKQERLGNQDNDAQYGNWLNMPYSGRLRYAVNLNEKGFPALKLDQFIETANDFRISHKQLNKLSVPEIKDAALPDGPPCLNYILDNGKLIEGQRNDVLFQVGIYLKKANADNLETELRRIARQYSANGDTIPDTEITNIVKSVGKKDYHYGCLKSPMVKYCNEGACAKCKFGAKKSAIHLDNRTLTLVQTDPPVWYITLETDRGPKTVSLSTDQLASNALFNKRVMETALEVLPSIEPEEWWLLKKKWMDSCQVIEIPEEATPLGQLRSRLSDYGRSATEDRKQLNTIGKYIEENDNTLVFKLSDFMDYLERMRFKTLKQHEIIAMLKNDLGGQVVRPVIEKCRIRAWAINRDALEEEPEPQTAEIPESPI